MREQAKEFVDVLAILGPCVWGFLMTGLWHIERQEKRGVIKKLEALQDLVMRKAGLGE
ncbi:MAG: hypothetical protein KC656_22225 [Myxococcales bacterium]|nr:hypothetical protein [Myxococcales bacterium]